MYDEKANTAVLASTLDYSLLAKLEMAVLFAEERVGVASEVGIRHCFFVTSDSVVPFRTLGLFRRSRHCSHGCSACGPLSPCSHPRVA